MGRAGRRERGESLKTDGLLCRMQLTQASVQGQVGQGCLHFANKETEARKIQSELLSW